MAKMRTGRTTPLTTDPTTGARIADPTLVGKKLPNDDVVSSWPAYRTALTKTRKESGITGNISDDPAVNRYMLGKTNELSENYDEPVITKDAGYMTFLRPGTKRYNETKAGYGKSLTNLTPGNTYRFAPGQSAVTDVQNRGNVMEYYDIRKTPAKIAKTTKSNKK